MTTAETAASTIAPSAPALHVPITSSMTNSTAVIGELNAAARPAAAPTGAINRSLSRDSFSQRPKRDARPAPICSDGSSGPSECPPPIASAQVTNFAMTVRNGDVAVRDVDGRLRLLHAAAARRREDEDDQRGDHQPEQRGHQHDAREGRLERRPEQQQPAPLDRDAEADDGEAGEDADQDGEQQEEVRLLQAGQDDAPYGAGSGDGCWRGAILRLSVPWRGGRAR